MKAKDLILVILPVLIGQLACKHLSDESTLEKDTFTEKSIAQNSSTKTAFWGMEDLEEIEKKWWGDYDGDGRQEFIVESAEGKIAVLTSFDNQVEIFMLIRPGKTRVGDRFFSIEDRIIGCSDVDNDGATDLIVESSRAIQAFSFNAGKLEIIDKQ